MYMLKGVCQKFIGLADKLMDVVNCIKRFIMRCYGFFYNIASFSVAIVKNPKSVGAIVPSSKYLARSIASYVDKDKPGLVVELGPGTGVVTEALLQKGIAPDRIVVIEFAAHLARRMKQLFPGITVIHGDAADLEELIAPYNMPVSAVVSGLPLRTLPEPVKSKILTAVPKVLADQGCYVQYTYNLSNRNHYFPEHCAAIGNNIVWRNSPPAKVAGYKYQAK